MKQFLLPFCLVVLISCSERNKNNPFDPNGDQPLDLRGRSFNKSVELSWSFPNLTDYTGFNLYRKIEDNEQFFTRIVELPRNSSSYTDITVEYGNTYNYIVKIASGNLESRPSNEISVTPGPGFNWILDENAYRILKTSYDLSYTFLVYDTYPGRPTDMAVSNYLQTCVILCTQSGVIHEIDFSGNLKNRYYGIRYPYSVAYDPVGSLFWIADSSGALYILDTNTDNISPVYLSLSKPISIHIAAQQNIISIVDVGEKEIVQINRYGYLLSKITSVNGKSLEGPSHYIVDEKNNRSWLIDGNSNIDYIYTKLAEDEEYFLADSVLNAGDIDISLSNELAWYVSYNRDRSIVLQLSADGTRQLELSYFYNPLDLHVNPYDGSLLVVDSWNGSVIHYDNSNRIIGKIANLVFPVKVVVQ